MYLVGLTGGIGSGKSTVARRLRELGCAVVDADEVAREIVAPGEPALRELAEHFGREILRDDGSLDRSRLAGLAFADDDARAALDRITHPRIAARIAERVAELAAAEGADSAAVVVVDHPLLVETGQAGRFDAVVVVTADEDARAARLAASRDLTESDVRARMRAQATDLERRAVATHVIENDGSRDELLRAVDALHRRLLADSGAVVRWQGAGGRTS